MLIKLLRQRIKKSEKSLAITKKYRIFASLLIEKEFK